MSTNNIPQATAGPFAGLQYLTSTQAARYLQVSRRTLDRLRARHIKLGAVKIGGQVRYNKDMLDDYLRKRADK